MLYMILIGSIIASLYEYKKLKEKHYVCEIMCSSIFLTVGIVLISLRIVNIELPSPLATIRYLFEPISRFITEILS